MHMTAHSVPVCDTSPLKHLKAISGRATSFIDYTLTLVKISLLNLTIFSLDFFVRSITLLEINKWSKYTGSHTNSPALITYSHNL